MVPLLLVVGLIESFVSPLPAPVPGAKAVLGLAIAAALWFYLAWPGRGARPPRTTATPRAGD